MLKLSEAKWMDVESKTIDDPLAHYIENERLRYEMADETFQAAIEDLFYWAEEDECLIH